MWGVHVRGYMWRDTLGAISLGRRRWGTRGRVYFGVSGPVRGRGVLVREVPRVNSQHAEDEGCMW